ncbi:MAG: ABC-2 transporter permease [Ruthenibacterium sp.]
MIGLLLKDYYCLRSYFFKQLGLMIIIYAVLSISMKSSSFFTPMMMMYVLIVLISCFSLDDSTQWNSFALTLPLAPKDIVAARYLLFLLGTIFAGVFGCTLSSVVDLIFFHQGLVEIWGSAAIVLLIYAVMSALCIPLFIKFGAEKARVWMTLLFMIPFIGITAFGSVLSKISVNFTMPSMGQIQFFIVLAVLAVFGLYYLSYRISVKIFTTKEF